MRRDVLATRRHDQVLLAVRDLEVAVGVEVADVPRVKPAVGVERLAGRVGLVVVALHDPRALGEDLAVGGDLDLHLGNGPADRPDLDALRRIDGQHGRRLGEPVPLRHGEAGAEEELCDLRAERCTPREEQLEAAAGARPQLGEHEPVRERMLQGEARGHPQPCQTVGRPVFACALRPEEDASLDPAPRERVLEHGGIHLFVEPRHREHYRRPDLLEILAYQLERFSVVDDYPGVEHGVVHHPLEHVRQRQHREALVPHAHGDHPQGALHVGPQVVVGEHHALRVARRPRRIDEGSELIRLYGQRFDPELRVFRDGLSSQRLEVGEGHGAIAARGRVEHDDVPQRW